MLITLQNWLNDNVFAIRESAVKNLKDIVDVSFDCGSINPDVAL